MEEPLAEDPRRETPESMERKNRRLVGRILRLFFLSAAVYVAYRFGVDQGRSELSGTSNGSLLSPDKAIFLNADRKEEAVDFALFWKVWDILKEKYVDQDQLDAKQLFYGAIDGMLAATGDPYTTFFDPREQKEFNEDISGKFGGIGAEMGIRDEILTVIAPLDDTPAQRAGLLPNDKVLEINGEVTTDFSLEESVSKIRGEKGTEVKLKIYRTGEQEPRELTIVRDIINVKSVKLTFREDGLAILRISWFGDDTEEEFRTALSEIVAKNPKGIILDLRSNPGGFLDTSIKIASAMLPAGKIVVIEENADGERREEKALGGDMLSGIRTVVLIDEGSASASEILAGALRENRDNVTLVGKKSYGKGTVQDVVPTSKDTSVKITIARWLTPSGHRIHEQGISPDIEISASVDDIKNGRDPQMDKAVEILNATDR